MKILRKISGKSITGDVKKAKEGFLYSIAGQARRTEIIATTFGDSVKFHGEFQAIDGNGEIYISGQAFLPDPVQSIVFNQLAKNPDEGVEFGFHINKRLDETSTVGYIYEVETILEPTRNTRLEEILKISEFDKKFQIENKNPEQPKDNPEQPKDNPEQPKDKPEQPKDNPEQPKDKPEQPKDKPKQPKDEPKK